MEINSIIKSRIDDLKDLKNNVHLTTIKNQLGSEIIKARIERLKNYMKKELCAEHPNAFWSRKQHIVDLSYEENFDEKIISTKVRPIQMSPELIEHCKKEIKELEDKKLISKSRSPWSCAAFYVNRNAEIERGTPILVINYKPLNTTLKWIRYHIPNKKDL